jgi:NAD(P)H-flavin reductase
MSKAGETRGLRVLPVMEARRETADTVTFELDPAPDTFPFAPGQFNMVYAFGLGEVPLSISGDPGDPRRLRHTVRGVGDVTRALASVRRGDAVGVRGPFGQAWPVEAAAGHDVLIVAGGIGLAPLRPAVCHVLAHRAQYGHVALLYGARTPADLLYARELQAWRGRFDLDVEVTVDRATAQWQGAVGVVTRLVPRVSFEPARTSAFVCGPEVMMRFAARELQRRGVPDDQVFLSAERNMKCGVGLCGHCQIGPLFACRDGPVIRYRTLAPLLAIREA